MIYNTLMLEVILIVAVLLFFNSSAQKCAKWVN